MPSIGPRLICPALLLALGTGCGRSEPKAARADTVVAPGRASVVALARLEPGTRVIEAAGTSDDRIAQLAVQEGAEVEAGAPLAYGSSHARRLAEKTLAEQRLAEAKALEAAERTHTTELITRAQLARRRVELQRWAVEARAAELGVAQVEHDLATAERTRASGLYDKAHLSARDNDAATLRAARARASLAQAKAAHEAAEASMVLDLEEAENQIRLAIANRAKVLAGVGVESLEAELALASARVEESVVRAPVGGKVLKILAAPGERMSGRTILHMGGTAQMYAVAEVYETDVHLVKPGQTAVITSAALPRPIEGVVETVGLMIFKKDLFGDDPTAATNARVFEVRIRLSKSDIASQYTNHEVEARIHTGGS